MPTGWSVDNSTVTSSSSCYSYPLEKVATVANGTIHFDQGGGLPELVEDIASYSSATSAFSAITGILDQCTSFTETVDGTTVSATLGAMSMPQVGDQSAAYVATISDSQLNENQGFVISRKGSVIVGVALGDVGPVDTATLQQFAAAAVAKVAA